MAEKTCPQTVECNKIRTGVELLDEIKSHEFVYKKSRDDVQGFTKMLNTLRSDNCFTDVTFCVKVGTTTEISGQYGYRKDKPENYQRG